MVSKATPPITNPPPNQSQMLGSCPVSKVCMQKANTNMRDLREATMLGEIICKALVRREKADKPPRADEIRTIQSVREMERIKGVRSLA